MIVKLHVERSIKDVYMLICMYRVNFYVFKLHNVRTVLYPPCEFIPVTPLNFPMYFYTRLIPTLPLRESPRVIISPEKYKIKIDPSGTWSYPMLSERWSLKIGGIRTGYVRESDSLYRCRVDIGCLSLPTHVSVEKDRGLEQFNKEENLRDRPVYRGGTWTIGSVFEPEVNHKERGIKSVNKSLKSKTSSRLLEEEQTEVTETGSSSWLLENRLGYFIRGFPR